MKKITLLIAFVFGAIITINAQETLWASDIAHSNIQFSVSHLVISEAVGSFSDFTIELKTIGKDFENADIVMTINVKSIDTDNEDRDDHLRSADFFDTEKYPEMSFKSTSFTKIGENKYKLAGNLTIKDVTKPQEFVVIYGGSANDPYGNIKAGFKLEGKINRFDYGLKWNNLLESGGAVVGEDVSINCNIQLNKNQ